MLEESGNSGAAIYMYFTKTKAYPTNFCNTSNSKIPQNITF